eukprot:1610034-Rhodomonas_salina.2
MDQIKVCSAGSEAYIKTECALQGLRLGSELLCAVEVLRHGSNPLGACGAGSKTKTAWIEIGR